MLPSSGHLDGDGDETKACRLVLSQPAAFRPAQFVVLPKPPVAASWLSRIASPLLEAVGSATSRSAYT